MTNIFSNFLIDFLKKVTINIFFILFSFTLKAQYYAPHGGPFTPKGDLRFLVIFAGFENSCDGSDKGIWPDVIPGQTNCKTFPLYANELFYSDFAQFNPSASDRTISNFYYQMSRNHPTNPPLRIVGDIFPERINIAGSHHNNTEVFKQINARYPDFDWSKYDKRKNTPNFKFDNSETLPDHIIDYIVIIWRQKGASGRASIESGFTFTTNVKGFPETFKVSDGFTIDKGMSDNTFHLKKLFHHELAHTLFNCPHFFGTNGAYGSYFYTSTGWGMMNYGLINSSANAWESWYNGWIELSLNKDLSNVKHNGIYTLSDFVTTGDAMRIKLPFCNQYLWIENHAGLTAFDEREGYTADGLNNEIPPPDKGLYMFIEAVADVREKKITPLDPLYVNGMKALHSKGNYDYIFIDYSVDEQWWKNIVANFKQGPANPTGAHNDVAHIRANYSYDTIFPEKIIYRSYTNNVDEYCRICSEECSGLGRLRQEAAGIVKKKGVYTYDELGIRMAFGNKRRHKIGMSSNPVLINHQRYICPDKLEPILLNGISIKILSKSSNGDITFQVKFNDTDIFKKQRFTGELMLHDIEDVEYDLRIKSKSTLTLDKSGSPNRYNKGALINGEYEFPDFINPSILTLDSNTKVLIEDKGSLVVANGSTLKIRACATLIIKGRGKLKIADGAYLCIEPGAIIIKDPKGKIEMGEKAVKGINPKLRLADPCGDKDK